MHEFGIARSIVHTVLKEIEQRSLTSVKRVGLRVGALSGVEPDALTFSFEAIVAESPLADCRLVLEHVPVQGVCRDCHRDFQVDDFIFLCPACGSGKVQVNRGRELQISYLDVDET